MTGMGGAEFRNNFGKNANKEPLAIEDQRPAPTRH